MEHQLVAAIEQFKCLRGELDLRVAQHSQLVAFKVVALGALVSYFGDKALTPTPVAPTLFPVLVPVAYFIWLIPLSAVVFDMLIAGNLRAMYNIGPYIRDFLEPAFREHSPLGLQYWEETVASTGTRHSCYRPVDVVVVWVFTLVAFLAIVAMRASAGYTVIDYAGSGLVAAGTALSLWLLVVSITEPRVYSRLHDSALKPPVADFDSDSGSGNVDTAV